MKKLIFILGVLFPTLVFSQAGEFFPKIPLKYKAPYPGMSTATSNERGEEIWGVMAARDNIPVYSDEECRNQKGTEKYLQFFWVWKETEDAVRVVKRRGSGQLMENYRFTSIAQDVGYIKKQDLVLGERCLSVDKTWVRALLKKVPDNRNLPPDMPGFNGKLDENGFGVFYVVKMEPTEWLLCVTDLIHEGFAREDVFWVKKSEITTIPGNRAYVPDWKKVSEGQKLYTFTDRNRTGNSDTSRAAMKIYRNNPFSGYFYVSDDQRIAKVMNPIRSAPDTQFINTSDARFLKANFMDNTQFTSIQNFAQILKESPIKELLKEKLIKYFVDNGVDTTKDRIRSMNVAEMWGYALGLDFSGYAGMDVTLVEQIKDVDWDSYNSSFNENYEKLLVEKDLEKFRFYSGMSYYWLPQNLLSLDILSKLTLFKANRIIIKGGNYKEYSIFYIDHSAPTEEKGYDQLQAEIRKLSQAMAIVWNAEAQANDVGDMIFYSSGVDPVIGSGPTGFESVAGQMRNSNTLRPDMFSDKLRLENNLLRMISGVTDKINIYFDVSDYFYQTELNGRSFLMKEFVERIGQMMATNKTKISVTLYINNPKTASKQSELQDFCRKMNSVNPNIKYEVSKI